MAQINDPPPTWPWYLPVTSDPPPDSGTNTWPRIPGQLPEWPVWRVPMVVSPQPHLRWEGNPLAMTTTLTTSPCGRCGTAADFELHGHRMCSSCVIAWITWLELHPHEDEHVALARGGHLHDAWLEAYSHFLAEGRAA